jgi:hypothetical protein
VVRDALLCYDLQQRLQLSQLQSWVQQCRSCPDSCILHLLLLLLLLLLQVYTPVPCPLDDMCSFHSREYLQGLKSVDAPKVS